MKRYECVSGYIIAAEGEYELYEEIEGIGEVQYIVDADADADADEVGRNEE